MITIKEIYEEMLKKKHNLPYDEKLIQNIYTSFEDIEKQYLQDNIRNNFISKPMPKSELKGEVTNIREDEDWRGYMTEKTGISTDLWLDYNSMPRGRLKRLERD